MLRREHVFRFCPKAEMPKGVLGALRLAPYVIQAPKLEARIMRYELSDDEWATIRLMYRTRLAACRA